ncbi:putative inorganic phosphate cotransporter isoform X3 [Nilaparvata lugens]|uniref:putative inorganic phosphate cotransporter isoform X3 n=1 Tax=Nilaparvata lugens TaxID=108931 RepID=UPI00193D35E8|nr:putative inorganic phosphate cotransporter isoform X3 [Nilaparvata lugens]
MLQVRQGQYLLLFICFSIAYMQRLDITVAIVAMTDRFSANPDYPEFPWSLKTKSKVLSAFFWGYFILQIPGGILARKFGPKPVLTTAVFVGSCASLLIPKCAELFDWPVVFALQFIQGLSQGLVHPSVYTHISQWSPVNERSRAVGFVFCGQQFGSVVCLLLSGHLASSVLGWPSVYYKSGIIGLLWTIAWVLWGVTSPASHKSISLEERSFIGTNSGVDDKNKKVKGIPWKAILTSRPVLVMTLANVCNNWVFWSLVTLFPSFLSAVYGFNIKNNSYFSTLPHLSMFVMALVFGAISDTILRKKLLTINANRKLWNSVAQWGGAVALFCIAMFRDSQTITLIMMTVGLAVNSATFLGFLSNHMDLSPNYSGILMGFTNCLSNIASMVAPLFAGFMVKDEKNADEWAVIFYTAAVIFIISNSIFLIFGSTKVQRWNSPD